MPVRYIQCLIMLSKLSRSGIRSDQTCGRLEDADFALLKAVIHSSHKLALYIIRFIRMVIVAIHGESASHMRSRNVSYMAA